MTFLVFNLMENEFWSKIDRPEDDIYIELHFHEKKVCQCSPFMHLQFDPEHN